MSEKIKARQRRSLRLRSEMKRLGKTRLCVSRSLQHICAQVIDADGRVRAQASTREKALREQVNYGGNVKAATAVGKLVAERAVAAGVTEVAFDRSGNKYHGRIKALADAAREAGLQF